MSIHIYQVTDKRFRRYGALTNGSSFTALLGALEKTPCPDNGVLYVPNCVELEETVAFGQVQNRFFGGMPAQIGYCNGRNTRLNALEYHRSSELLIAGEDLVLLLGSRHDIEECSYDTALVEAFFVPKGAAVELFATTLHFAPCTAPGKTSFRAAIALPRFTNYPLAQKINGQGEDKFLYAINKWLIAHPDSEQAKEGASVGLCGENLSVG